MSFKSKEGKRKLGLLDNFVKRVKSNSSGDAGDDNKANNEGDEGNECIDVDKSDKISNRPSPTPTACSSTCPPKDKNKCFSSFKLDIGNYVTVGETNKKGLNLDDFTKYELLVNHWQPPKDYVFPHSLHIKKGKKEKRKISYDMLSKFPWLVYSESSQGLYCKLCVIFISGCKVGGQKTLQPQKFVTRPLQSYAKLTGKDGDLIKHQSNLYHLRAEEKAKLFIAIHKNKSLEVGNMLDKERKTQIEENRKRLYPIIKTILLHGRQNIPLRGHRDDTQIFEANSEGDLSLPHLNDGNFKAFLRFRVESGDKDLENHLKTAKSNATYISKTTCNSLINCCGEEILNNIVRQVNESQYYSVLFDETTDISHHSQLSVSIRYFSNSLGLVREDFVGFTDLHLDNFDPSKNEDLNMPVEPKIDGKTLGKSVVRKLQSLGLDLKNCVGIGCDGCSVNVSAVRGAVSEIQKTAINAVLSSCFNHRLNLSISKTMNVKCVKNAMGIIQEVVAFFNASAKRHFVLKKYLKTNLNSPCETRWIERHDSILQFKVDLFKICDALNEISEWNEGNSSSKANILLKAICDCEFILTVHILSEIFNVTLPLSKFFQGKNIGLDNAVSYVKNVIDVLKQKRANSENEFSSIIQSASNLLETFGLELQVPRLTSRQTQRVNIPASNAVDYWRKASFIPILDYIILDLTERFSDKTLHCFSLNVLLPINLLLLTDYSILKENITLICNQFLGLTESVENEIAKLLGEVQIYQKTIEQNASCQTAIETLVKIDQNFYPIIAKYLKVLVTLPISVATSERSFSTLRRVKSWMRSRMTQDRLDGLALLHVHRDIDIDVDRVIDRFAKASRKLQFVL